MHVLIVMNDPLAAMLRRRLWRDGHVVDLVARGADSVAQAGGDEYDAIILDNDLPDMDGVTAVGQLRGNGSLTPILMTAGRKGVEERVRGLNAGADADPDAAVGSEEV